MVWSLELCSFDLGRYIFFFFKQKTAYEMRISDWSSDVCSSDLIEDVVELGLGQPAFLGDQLAHGAPGLQCLLGQRRRFLVADIGVQRGDEIGRASCRERVCQYV